MKAEFLSAMAIAALVSLPNASLAAGDHPVKGHVTKSGTYVPPTRATNPNATQRDNYGSKPNMNPATGKAGSRNAVK